MKKIFYPLIILLSIGVIYRSWFTPGILSKGDNHFLFPSMYSSYSLIPQAWDTDFGYGLGHPVFPLIWSSFINTVPIVFYGNLLHLDWEIVERLAYFFPVLIIGLFGVFRLHREVTKSKSLWWLLGVLLLLCNTYILMLAAGQILITLSISFSLIVLAQSLAFFDATFTHAKGGFRLKRWFEICLFTLLMSILLHLDLRIFYVVSVGIALIFAARLGMSLLAERFVKNKNSLISFGLSSFVVGILTIGLNFYWLYPLLTSKGPIFEDPTGSYTTTSAVNFFSFANFEHALGLLHPNWPDNVFGLTSFMKPEFLLLPILAFSSLLFLKAESWEVRRRILPFALLPLLGAFLAKGSQEPFGNVYLWLFDHIPGFVMFRDPTKWYVLVLIGYIVLIPITLHDFFIRISASSKPRFLLLIFIVVLVGGNLLMLYPALLGKLPGSFHSSTVPQEYKELDKFLAQDPTFSRTLWIPALYRYGHNSANHPAVTASDYFRQYDTKKLLVAFDKPTLIQKLQEASIKYVIVPFDNEKDLYIVDRTYSQSLYKQVYQKVSDTSGLVPSSNFEDLGVFAVPHPKGHFWTKEVDNISFSRISATNYLVRIVKGKKNERLVFTDRFNSEWKATIGSVVLLSQDYNGLNSFVLPKDGNYLLDVEYTPQQKVITGLVVSGVSLVTIVLTCFLFLIQKGYHKAK